TAGCDSHMRRAFKWSETRERLHRPAVQDDQPAVAAPAASERSERHREARAEDVRTPHSDGTDIPQCGRAASTNESEVRVASGDEDVLPVTVVCEVTVAIRDDLVVTKVMSGFLVSVRCV